MRFYELGGTRGDLFHDMERGFCQINSVQTFESLPNYVSFLFDHSVCGEPFADTIGHMNCIAPYTHEFINAISGRSDSHYTTNDQDTGFNLWEENYTTTPTEGHHHNKGCALKDFKLLNFEGAPKSCLYPDAREDFPTKVRDGISSRESKFEKEIESEKTKDQTFYPVNSIYEHNSFEPMENLLSEMFSLISEQFIDVFKHIRILKADLILKKQIIPTR